MENLLHRDNDDRNVSEHSAPGDREITLGTTMILAIFFALAVFAAVFFGFGYSMGSKRNAAAPPSPVVASSPASTTGAAAAKPNAGNLFSDPASGATGNARAAQSTRVFAPAPNGPPTRRTEAMRTQQPAASSSGPALAPALQPVVQIAAVSHQEDADLLVSTLKRRGYAVAVRNDQRDKLLHVQVGPFATRQEADAMRQRLVADGFNAIVKEPAR